jgi:hypothetical protein
MESKCPVCRKTFIPAPQHVYKTANGKNLVCSYHCMLEDERVDLVRREKGRETLRRKK